MIDLTDIEKENKHSDRDTVYAYHDRTKHHLHQYARSVGYMDWDSQPDPFRKYQQAPSLSLEQSPVTDVPTYDSLFTGLPVPPATVNRDSISHLFYESMAISAWKQAGAGRWSLRVNPSSGDLHPTEAYLISGPVTDLNETAAVFHYSPYVHALERRALLMDKEWHELTQDTGSPVLYVALTSIYWRESWKYGERAFRYCHHDVGHAVAALAFAAATLGWRTRKVDHISDESLSILLGLHLQEGNEAEHPDCLLAIFPAGGDVSLKRTGLRVPTAMLERFRVMDFEGRPNILSRYHQDWPLIDAVSVACRGDCDGFLDMNRDETSHPGMQNSAGEDRPISARKIIRQRRSAVAMDGCTGISSDTFYRMMAHVSELKGNPVIDVLGWRARVSLAIFIHRVAGLPAGLYLLVRDPIHEASLRRSLHPDFLWQRPQGCPQSMPLYQLAEGDVRDAARTISCHQDIAADGAFAMGMLAQFDFTIKENGASYYPRLFWETGLIGQILYLEAEAAGIRATGIGCFFDDAMHELLGIHDHTWQSLYHFTVGRALDDPRIQTLPSYGHVQ